MTLPSIRLQPPVGASNLPILILTHSLGTTSRLWEQCLPALKKSYRVSLLTLPGHEDLSPPSEPFTLQELSDAVVAEVGLFEVKPFFYAGVSIGGALGLELAVHHPTKLLGAAIVASAASLGSPEHWTHRAKLVREESTTALLELSGKNWFAPETHLNAPNVVERILGELKHTSSEGYARCAEALSHYDVRAFLPNIKTELLLLFGEHDTTAPQERQDEILEHVPNARKHCITHAAHQLPAEQPEATTQALLTFFEHCIFERRSSRYLTV